MYDQVWIFDGRGHCNLPMRIETLEWADEPMHAFIQVYMKYEVYMKENVQCDMSFTEGMECPICAGEAVPRTPWPGYGIQPVSGPLTPCTACSVP